MTDEPTPLQEGNNQASGDDRCRDARATESIVAAMRIGDPAEVVRQYFDAFEIEVLFDGSLYLKGRPIQANRPEEFAAVLAVNPPTLLNICDQLSLLARRRRIRLSRSDVQAALRLYVDEQKNSRRVTVMGRLASTSLTVPEQNTAREQWNQLARLFDMDQDLAIAVLQHFIWSVKQKAGRRRLQHHLMPIIFSTMQGTGKSRFLEAFLSPLRELAAHGALFSDLTDSRSSEIFQFPVVVLDDMEKIPAAVVERIKSVLTNESLRRRPLGTSFLATIRQACMPIGSSNKPIQDVVPDTTGHRRFVMLPFRNGDIAKGGNVEVWEIVNAMDSDLLWRSVDALAPTPILAQLDTLQQYQALQRPKSGLLHWLLTGLDLSSDEMRDATTRTGVKADKLRNLYIKHSGEEVSQHRFKEEMEATFSDPNAPFGDRVRKDAGWFYRLKQQKRDEAP